MHEQRPHGERPHDARSPRGAAAPPVGAFGDLVAALRVVASRQLGGDGAPVDLRGDLHDDLRAITRMARARGLSAAQVITAAKAAWAGLTEAPVHLAADSQGADAGAVRLERLVSLCVEAYYSG